MLGYGSGSSALDPNASGTLLVLSVVRRARIFPGGTPMSWWFFVAATVWVAMDPEDSALDKARSAYEDGDYATALAGFESVAVSGNPTATRYIVYMYLRGDGVRKDLTKAVALFRRAAERGDLLSVFSLG